VAVQLVTTVLKFVPLLAIGVIGLFFMKSGNFSPFVAGKVGTLHGITTAAALTLWAFIGLESSTVPAEEVKDPERTIPRSTIIGTISTTALYVLATIAVMGVIPMATLANSTSPFADAARAIFNTAWVGKAVAIVAMISTFGALNGWILLQGRVPLAAAEDGLFPRRFARVTGSRRTPAFALVVSSIGITIVTFMFYNQSLVNMFTQVILLATLTTLVPYAFAAAAQAQLFFTDRARFSGRSFAKDMTVALLAFAYSVWAIWGSGIEIIAKGFMLLLFGIPVYVLLRWRQSVGATLPVAPVSADGNKPSQSEKSAVSA
jgi:APA family basic amino acid/polyamine antiporter